MWGWGDVGLESCEGGAMWGWGAVGLGRCEGAEMWDWGDVGLGGCASRVAGGSQYTTSCEPPCGLAVLLGWLVPHQSREIII